MAGRTRRKGLALAVLPAAATTLALATGVGPAAADTKAVSHTYTDLNGFQHTCTVNMTRTIPFNNDSQVGQGATSVTGSSNCSGVISYIAATFDDPDGETTSTIENSDGQSTTRRYAPVGSNFVTRHHVDFTGVPAGCQSGCEFFDTRSK
jgi:hypothetical protein